MTQKNNSKIPCDNFKESTLSEFIKHPLFSLAFNSLKNAILFTDPNGIVLFINDEYSRLTGIDKKTILGKYVGDARQGSRLPDVLRTRRSLRGIRRKVDNIEYIADLQPILKGSTVLGGISVLQDITEIVNLGNKINAYSSKIKEFHRALYFLDDIISESDQIERIKKQIQNLGLSDAPVLLTGESGTGKELFAHAVHNASIRKDEPFVFVNCAAFTPQLLLSELFGYEEGAFTGARRGGKLGLFEIANHGTLFLDEIGDMESDMQSKILRVLEGLDFTKVGGTKLIKVDVRIISATNKNLDNLIAVSKFRSDLFYRLNVFHLHLPPLRSRPEDIPLLIKHYINKLNKKNHGTLTIDPTAVDRLFKYKFPGNVRELFNILEFAAQNCNYNKINIEHLPIIQDHGAEMFNLAGIRGSSEKELLFKILSRYDNSVQGKRLASKELGISLATLYNKIRQYGITYGRPKSSDCDG